MMIMSVMMLLLMAMMMILMMICMLGADITDKDNEFNLAGIT
jgi:hypothetical protein